MQWRIKRRSSNCLIFKLLNNYIKLQSPFPIIFIFFLTHIHPQNTTQGQEFQITNVPIAEYSIDRFTNNIYYKHFFTGDIFKTNSTGDYHILTNFTSVPAFVNNSHKAAYVVTNSTFDKDLYLYDFEKDTTYFLINYNVSGSSKLIISPSDDKIMILSGSPLYFSFNDSSLHDPGFRIIGNDMNWISDTSVIYRRPDDGVFSYNVYTEIIDTLIIPSNLVHFRGLAYNKKLNVIAYSWEINQGENAFLNLYYLNSRLDTTVYNYLEDGPSIWGFSLIFEYLTWIEEYGKLGFIGQIVLDPFSFIYAFDYNSFQTKLYTDFNGDIEYKGDLNWMNNDTIVYRYFNRFLYGMNVTYPVSVWEYSLEDITQLNVKVYPNPFNGSTRISVYIPSSGDLIIELFDCIGQSLSKSNYGYLTEGKVVFNWSEIIENRILSAGVYFVKIALQSNRNTFHKTVKVMYLK